MADILIFDTINRIIWIFTIFLLLICGFFFYLRGRRNKTSIDRYLLFGFSSIFLGLTLQRLFFFISDYFATGSYIGGAFYGYYNILDPTYTNLVSIGYLFFFISVTISIVMYESVLKESKYLFSLISLIALMTFLSIPISYKIALRYFLIFINGALLLIVFIRILKIPDKKFLSIARLILISLALYVIGSIADSGAIKQLAGTPSIPFVFFIASAVIGLSASILNPEEKN